jgi:hypothetical protein
MAPARQKRAWCERCVPATAEAVRGAAQRRSAPACARRPRPSRPRAPAGPWRAALECVAACLAIVWGSGPDPLRPPPEARGPLHATRTGHYSPPAAALSSGPAFSFGSAARPDHAECGPADSGPGPGAYDAAGAFHATAPRAPAALLLPRAVDRPAGSTPGPGHYDAGGAAEWGPAEGGRFGTAERALGGPGPEGPGPAAYDAAGAFPATLPHVRAALVGPAVRPDPAGGGDERGAWAAPRLGPGPGEYDPGPGPQHRVPLGVIHPPPPRDAGGPGPADGPGPGAYDPAPPVRRSPPPRARGGCGAADGCGAGPPGGGPGLGSGVWGLAGWRQ